MARQRRRSNLGADIRGDTGAPAVSTLDPSQVSTSTESPPKDLSKRQTRKRRKSQSYFRQWIDLSFRHTWVNPLIATLLVLAAYAINPTQSNPFHAAIFLSYPLPRKLGDDSSAPLHYGKGARDFAFVGFYIIVLSFTREFLMQRLIRPMAISFGIKGRGKQSRFMEQVYTAMYFAVFGPLGLYVMRRTPMWYFNTSAFFEDFPHRSHEGVFKAYYLLQAAYWAQQAIVLMLQLEKPRKDFKELVGHHIITLALIWLSYRFHFTHMGLAVYITHDISDFFLATSKTLNYLDSVVVGPYFALFVGVWVYLRHYINLRILWATLTEFRTVGPYELDWHGEQYKCWISQLITFVLLACLQAVNLFWLFFIVRIAKNYVFSSQWADERSDAEDDDANDEAEQDETSGLDDEEEPDADQKERYPGRSAKKSDVSILVNGTAINKDGEEESYSDAVKQGANGGARKRNV
ncbi:MAG: hypothetical protein M4579_006630 [Chaenotheca gracillima]|nr:MAG: hypothetical protein M4579_006630 [Chaenotheca gracillima]